MRGFLPLILLLLAYSASAFQINEIREFDASNVSGYPEIGSIRQSVLLSYYSQGRGELPGGFPAFANASLHFMARFRDAYELSSTKEADKLLMLPATLSLTSDSLNEMEGRSSDSIPLSKFSAYLASSVLEKYISNEAEKLKSLGDAEPQTKKKLSYFMAAYEIFRYSKTGVRAAEVKAGYEILRSTYESDIASADSMLSKAKAVCEDSTRSSGDWFGIPSYAGLRSCTSDLTTARGTYVSHLEYERIKEVDAALESASAGQESLTGRMWGFFLSLTVGVLIVNAVFISRIKKWRDDDYDSSLGSEVFR